MEIAQPYRSRTSWTYRTRRFFGRRFASEPFFIAGGDKLLGRAAGHNRTGLRLMAAGSSRAFGFGRNSCRRRSGRCGLGFTSGLGLPNNISNPFFNKTRRSGVKGSTEIVVEKGSFVKGEHSDGKARVT
jgi:hypothetical protein